MARTFEPGQLLSLKPQWQHAYGVDTDTVKVIEVYTKDGYRTPWIRGEFHHATAGACVGSFRPSDFRR